MAATVNLELDPVFLKALGFLHSKSKDSAEKLKALLDESLSRGIDSCYRPQQKEVDQPKVSIPKPVSVKTAPSLPTSNNNGKPTVVEKVKKEVEKRIVDKVKVEISEGIDIAKKPRLEKPEAHTSSITIQTSKDLPMADLSSFEETSADDFAMEMGLACVVCRQITVTSGNPLVECQECHNLYHQDCHKPQVTDKEMNDPRVVWYCARCTRQIKKMAQKTQKPSQKPAPAVVSVVPAVKDPLIKKPEIKLKLETTPAFLAFKRTEVKTSATMSGNSTAASVSSSSNSGLTGWAAFAAKTSSAGPSTTKMGSATQSTSGKPVTGSNNQKPTGLSGLATTKGVGSKITAASSTNPSQLKPLPPLTLGKVGLSRSVSSDNVSKIGLPNAGSSTPGNSPTIGGNGSSVAAGSSASKSSTESGNQSPSLKGPTSQESQLNAMKRLQMVKKKAAQKKLKK
ncbi:integrator complex subunit 12 [Pantherophis guttatus]|uniref:Integrator complex subunit 12 n=1 Tax=Pantherophis guttatus TaxID=94885 RepID=A0A6P9DQQ4_PANGU|nr:integrator complex subunit 12 [Pantherophis guttatus]XP_060542911.1 integrator complex subunit 12 [Pantherophis guttatus]